MEENCENNRQTAGRICRGNLEVAGGIKISYVPQSADFLCGTLQEYAKARNLDLSLLLTVLRHLDFERAQFEKRMEAFSEGQKKKVLLAASLCEPANLYIWDEPLNYIDVFSRIQLEQVICAYRPTMILVEHDDAFVKRIAARILKI